MRGTCSVEGLFRWGRVNRSPLLPLGMRIACPTMVYELHDSRSDPNQREWRRFHRTSRTSRFWVYDSDVIKNSRSSYIYKVPLSNTRSSSQLLVLYRLFQQREYRDTCNRKDRTGDCSDPKWLQYAWMSMHFCRSYTYSSQRCEYQ